MFKYALAVFLAAVPTVALEAMPVSQFLSKADALEKKGAMAVFSSDIGVLKKEITDAAAQLKAEREAARRAGRKPAYCPREGEKGSLNSKEILAHFRAIPPAQRGMQVKDGLRGLFARKFPCRA